MATDGVPMKPMLTLSFVLMTEAMCMTMVWPFCAYLVTELGSWDSTTAGYISGSLVAAFQVGQIFFAPLWGARSDRFGRRPIILCGIFASGISGLGFGLSSNIYMALFFRFLWGSTNANVTVVKTACLEILDGKTEGKGFSILSTAWSVGGAVGPAIGGLLYNPCDEDSPLRALLGDERMPTSWTTTSSESSSSEAVMCRYPALLPCLFITLAAVANFFVVSSILKETIKGAPPEEFSLRSLWNSFWIPVQTIISKCCAGGTTCDVKDLKGCCDSGDEIAADGTSELPNSITTKSFSFNQCLTHPMLRLILINDGTIAAVNIAFGELLPLFSMAPRSHGGLGLSAKYVSLIFAFNGGIGIVVNGFFPALEKRYGRLGLWRNSLVVWIVILCFFPTLHLLRPPDRGGVVSGVSSLAICLIAFFFVAPRALAVNNIFGLNMILTGIFSPEGVKGQVMAYSVSVAAVGRSVSPLLFAPLFAWSIQSHERNHSTAPHEEDFSISHDELTTGKATTLNPFPFDQFFVYLLLSALLLVPLLTMRDLREEQLHRQGETNSREKAVKNESDGHPLAEDERKDEELKLLLPEETHQ